MVGKISKLLPIFFTFTAVLLFYFPAFSTYFSQDDFFTFKVSQTDGSLKQFINLFGVHSFQERGIAFYRPLFRDGLFNLYYSFFGLNHTPFRFLSVVLQFINIILVFLFANKLFNSRTIAIIASAFFGITAANVASVYYITGGIQSQGVTLFILLTLIMFLRYVKTKNRRFKILSLLIFLFALASHELAIVMPVLLIGIIYLNYPLSKFLRVCVKELWFYVLITGIYLYLDYFKIGYSQSETQYQAVFSIKKAINTYSWYMAWALGLPEMLIDWVGPGLKLNPSLLRYWDDYYKVIFPTFFLSISSLVIMVIYLFFKSTKLIFEKRLLFLVIWFFVALCPVVYLPLHKSTYYLLPALPGFWMIIAYILVKYADSRATESKIAIALPLGFIISAFLLSFTSARLGEKTYWAATRGKIAGQLIAEISQKYPTLPKGTAIYLKNDPQYPYVAADWGGTSKQAAYVLNNSDALQLLYRDPNLKVFYEDLGGVPDNLVGDQLYTLTAKIQ